jgi:Calx-beta domain/Bacterial Ig domain/Divergent InlB B-repeat domain/Putative binding domain, N-terminal
MNRRTNLSCWQRNYSPTLTLLAVCLLQAASAMAQGSATVQFDKDAYPVKESASNVTLVVVRSGSTNEEVRVDFQTVDQNATAGADYSETTGTLIFAPGVRRMNLNVAILRDFTDEADEAFTVELKDPAIGATIGGRFNATVTILDDDTCGYVISPTSRTHDWEGTPSNYLFSVQATNGCPWSVSKNVQWIFAFGSGTSNGVVQYSVDPNTNNTARTGKIFVAGKVFTVTQLGAPLQDHKPPTVTFLTPAAGARLTNTTSALITGKTLDAGTGGVALVEFRLENANGTNAYTEAEGTTNWSANIDNLSLGTNVLRVRAKDNAENLSAEVARSFVVVSASPLTVRTNGAGKVAPVLNGQQLEVGRTYTLIATPPKRNFFTGWSGGIATNVAKLIFQMQTNLVLQANFVTNPFVATKGTYNGLFFDEDAIRHDNSGFFTATVAESGAFSARATLAGKTIPFSGKLGLDGNFTNAFPQPGTNDITLRLSLDITGASTQLTGDLGDGNFFSSITSDRAKTLRATNFNGTYTLVIPGTNTDNTAHGPNGHSAGTLTVKGGSVSFVGSLADNTPIAQKVPLSQDGHWPFFQTLYTKGGSMLGWINFSNRMEDDLRGDLSWLKPVFIKSPFYTNGFPYRATATGSRYHQPSTGPLDPVLDFTDATLGFTGGNLIEAFTNRVVLTNATKLLNLSSNSLAFTLTKANGSFSGSVTLPTVPNSGRKTSYKGVVHQKGNYGAGFSLGTNETSAVRLEKVP